MRALVPTLLFAAAVTTMTVATAPGAPDAKKVDEKKATASLEGGYTLVSGEKDGKVIPEAEIKGSIVRIIGDKIIGTDKDKKEFFSSTFTLDTSKKPWAITMKSAAPKEVTVAGIVKKEGDTVTIVYALPGAEAPKEFKTTEHQHLFVLKNTNKGELEPNKFKKDK